MVLPYSIFYLILFQPNIELQFWCFFKCVYLINISLILGKNKPLKKWHWSEKTAVANISNHWRDIFLLFLGTPPRNSSAISALIFPKFPVAISHNSFNDLSMSSFGISSGILSEIVSGIPPGFSQVLENLSGITTGFFRGLLQ